MKSIKNNSRRSVGYNKIQYTNSNYRQKVASFSLPNSVKNGEYTNSVNIIPEVNDYIFDEKGNGYRLEKQIGRVGGEGLVYITSKKGYVCKIYKINKNTNFKQEKITLLTKNRINVKGVCLPEFIAFNKNNEFAGYFMKQADGIEIKTSILIPPLLKKKFPHWTRLHLATVALNILETVETLHEHNIILGDINPNNILIKDEHNIYFIDTDSFQVEGYPCSVGMVPYTRIENHGKRYSEYLRTKDDDIFAIMTLIFQILMPGKLPYSFSGGGSERENMKPENFPYKCYDGGGYDNAPDGQWVYIWSHLPRKLKELFCTLFKSGETIHIYEAVKNIESYIYQLKERHQTNLIFPSSFKHINKDGNVVNDETSKHINRSGENIMSNNLMILRNRDLIDNPITRLPVCLCLDSSHSMIGPPINELNKGVQYFFDAIKTDEIARYSVEMAVVSFNSEVETISDFSSVDRQTITLLEAGGSTSMGEGVELALDLLDQRKGEYSSKGVDYYQPWLVLMSDGAPTDNISTAVRRVQELSSKKKLTVFSVAIGDNTNIDVLKQFSLMGNNLVLKIKSAEHFKEFFEWLSQSVNVTSQSVPGDKISLPQTPPVIEIEL